VFYTGRTENLVLHQKLYSALVSAAWQEPAFSAKRELGGAGEKERSIGPIWRENQKKCQRYEKDKDEENTSEVLSEQ